MRNVDPHFGLARSLRPLVNRLHSPRSDAEGLEAVVRLEGSLRLLINTCNLVERDAYFFGYEPELRRVVRRFLSPGNFAIDVGANVGIITLVMSKCVGESGVVWACEPNPAYVDKLRRNLALNRIPNVQVFEAAVSDRAGQARLAVPRDPVHAAGGSLGAGMHEHLKDAIEIPVQTVRLDELVASGSPKRQVDLIKIDVEGYEAKVLSGAMELLRRDRPVLLFEYTGPWWAKVDADLGAVLATLLALGYTDVRHVAWWGLRQVGGPPHRPRMNVLCWDSSRSVRRGGG